MLIFVDESEAYKERMSKLVISELVSVIMIER